jgi:hypothetical protein
VGPGLGGQGGPITPIRIIFEFRNAQLLEDGQLLLGFDLEIIQKKRMLEPMLLQTDKNACLQLIHAYGVFVVFLCHEKEFYQ